MKVLTLLLTVALCVAAAPTWAQYYDDPYNDPYFNPWAPQTQQRERGDWADEAARRAIPSYEQQALEEQRRQNSDRNSWMNMCNAMGGNAAAQALCYDAMR